MGNSLNREVSIAMLGMKLRDAAETQISWPNIEKMAKKNFPGKDGMDKEYMALVEKAIKVYAKGD